MSRHDFPAEEFAARHARAREAVGAAGLDWLLVIHPMSLHWLIGTEAKSYQTFQCLLLSAKPDLLVMFTRLSERCELVEDSLADEVIGWGGPEPEDPLEAFRALVDRFGLRRGRVGLFFFNDSPPTEIYTLSLHDALPISQARRRRAAPPSWSPRASVRSSRVLQLEDRKSTRLNSSHVEISYAVFCLKKKNSDNTNLSMSTIKTGTRYLPVK